MWMKWPLTTRETQASLWVSWVRSLWQRKDFGSRDSSDPGLGDSDLKVPGLKSMEATLDLQTNIAPMW